MILNKITNSDEKKIHYKLSKFGYCKIPNLIKKKYAKNR